MFAFYTIFTAGISGNNILLVCLLTEFLCPIKMNFQLKFENQVYSNYCPKFRRKFQGMCKNGLIYCF